MVHLSFPDAHRRERLSPDKWRVHLLPLQARGPCFPLARLSPRPRFSPSLRARAAARAFTATALTRTVHALRAVRSP